MWESSAAFLQRYQLSGLIVRGADTGRLALAPQAAGLLAVSLGLSANESGQRPVA
jgi:hypothetical protein